MNGELLEIEEAVREALERRLPPALREEITAAELWVLQLRRDGTWLVSGDALGTAEGVRLVTRFMVKLRRTRENYIVLRVDAVTRHIE